MDPEIYQVALFKKDLSDEERMRFDVDFSTRRKDTTTALLLSIFLGVLGVDRFYLGHIGLGVAKLLLTWATFGIWWFIDIFLITKATRKNNTEVAQQVYDAIKMMRSEPK